MTKIIIRVITLAFLVLSAQAGLFRFSWDLNKEIDLNGYKVYWATSPNDLATTNSSFVIIPYPKQWSIDINSTNFIPKIPYYFAIVAYNSIGLESELSNVICLTNIPSKPTPPSPVANFTGQIVE